MKRVNNIYQWAALVVITLLFGACANGGSHSLEDYKIDLYTPHYATGFKILAAENSASSIIEISNPWQGASGVKTRLFISRGGESAPNGFDGQVINDDVKHIVTMSSTQIAMLDAVGCVERVVGVSGMNYISNDYVTAHKASIADVGHEGGDELRTTPLAQPRPCADLRNEWRIADGGKAQRAQYPIRLHRRISRRVTPR